MLEFNNLNDWTQFRATFNSNQRIGFIATMGNLHSGHAALIERSIKDNDFTVVSIFVNPTQFNRIEDLENYPRTQQQDRQLLQSLGVSACIRPSYEALYADNYHYQVQETHLSQMMEGPTRPGHFTGVLTVVLKLLMLVKASRAYFGEKDYQQYRLIAGMSKAFFLDTNIIAHPTIREADGLPFSSRNSRLNLAQRKKAGEFAAIFHQTSAPLSSIKRGLEDAGICVEYIEEHQQRRYIAVMIDDIRLIDNYLCDC